MTREHYLQQLGRLNQAAESLGDLVVETARASLRTLEALDVSTAKSLIEADNKIDSMRHDIEREAFVLIATQQPTATDLREIMGAWMIAAELERIGDYCSGIAKLTLTISQDHDGTSPLAPDIDSVSRLSLELLAQSLTAFKERDVIAAAEIWKRDDEVDDQYSLIFRRQIDLMVKDRHGIRFGTYLLWVAHNIERIADRVTNIAEIVAFIVTGNAAEFRDRLTAESVPT